MTNKLQEKHLLPANEWRREVKELTRKDGVYNIKDGSKDIQQFIIVKDGKATEIEKEEVLSYI